MSTQIWFIPVGQCFGRVVEDFMEKQVSKCFAFTAYCALILPKMNSQIRQLQYQKGQIQLR